MSNVNQYFDWGFKCFPAATIFIKKDGETKKVPIFGKKDSEYSQWGRCEHTPETFKDRWKQLSECGKNVNSICIKTGKDSGITVIDLDNKPGAKETLLKFVPDIYTYPHEVTPSGGCHFYCKYSSLTRTITTQSGIDVRSDGGMVIAAPSKSAKGEYKWVIPIKSVSELPAFPPYLIGFLFGFGTYRNGKKSTIKKDRIDLSEIENMLQIMENVQWSYDEWLKICSGLWSDYTFEETIPLLRKYNPFPHFRKNEYANKYKSKLTEVTMGTFMHYYKQALNSFEIKAKNEPIRATVEKSIDYTPVVKKGNPWVTGEELSPEEFRNEVETHIKNFGLSR
jgi:hypothetical protein